MNKGVIASYFEEFMSKCYPGQQSSSTRKHLHRAFLAGGLSILSSMEKLPDLEEEEATRMLAGLYNEAVEKIEEMFPKRPQ